MTLFVLAFVALLVVWVVRAVLAASRRVDALISDGLQEIDFERWEANA